MTQLQIIKTEIDTDPLTRGYSGMSDKQVADSLNTADRDAPADPLDLLNYCVTNEFRNGPIYGRIAMVAAAKPDDVLPLDLPETGLTLTLKHIAAAHAFLRFMEPDVQSSDALTSAGWESVLQALAGGAGNAQCLGPADKTAIQALSQNRQSRGNEIGAGRVYPVNVLEARALV